MPGNQKEMLRQLFALVPAPEQPVATDSEHIDWESVEGQLGTRLPEDYKAIIDRYGSGDFCDVLTLLNPFCEREDLNLLAEVGPEPELYGAMLGRTVRANSAFFPSITRSRSFRKRAACCLWQWIRSGVHVLADGWRARTVDDCEVQRSRARVRAHQVAPRRISRRLDQRGNQTDLGESNAKSRRWNEPHFLPVGTNQKVTERLRHLAHLATGPHPIKIPLPSGLTEAMINMGERMSVFGISPNHHAMV